MAAIARATVALLALTTAVQGKKQKLPPQIRGCWTKVQGSERQASKARKIGVTLCFGLRGRLRATVLGDGENFETEGRYRGTRDDIQLLGFPGDGWPIAEALETCQYSFGPGSDALTLKACSFSGDWRKDSCAATDDFACGL